tara:strand:+ start:3736 stop:4353 length:618 start_codon:yes stop_codon:yes gene_type:complete
MQIRKLIVYGKLRKFLKQSHFDVAVHNPLQAVSFLIHNFPKVEKHMMEQNYAVKMGETEISEDLLNLNGDGDIKIIPVAAGARGFGRIITGAALIGLSVATGGFGAAAIGTFGLTAPIAVSTIATTIGTSLIVGGVTEMLTPQPPVPNFSSNGMSDQDPNLNFGFSSITNTSRAGVPVPIIYGQVFTGSVVISSGIDTVQVEGSP